MERTALVEEKSFHLVPILVVILTSFFLILRHLKRTLSSPIPPGPYPWPVLGNVFQIGSKTHVNFSRFAKAYGPLFSLRIEAQLVVIGSSKEAATEILKTHDRILSARHVPDMVVPKSLELNDLSLIWNVEGNNKWKHLRSLCKTKLFSGKALESQACIVEDKIAEMIGFIERMEGRVVKIRQVAFATIFNLMGNVLISRDLTNLEDESAEEGFSGIMRKMYELAGSLNISDLYPILARFDLQGTKRKNYEFYRRTSSMWEPIICEKVRQRKAIDASIRRDFLDALLDEGAGQEQIDILLLELVSAGTETISSAIEWVMAELIKNPEHLRKVQQEIKREVNQDTVKQSHLSQLTYLEACVKETLRLHPSSLFLLPRHAVEPCQVMGYTIPKDAQVLVNVWAIGRDPNSWEDPLVFNPERFLNSRMDLKGNDFGCIPFGAGRRICPGLPMAMKHVPVVVASLIQSFDWSLPDGKNHANLDMSEKYGLTLIKERPRLLIPAAKMEQ